MTSLQLKVNIPLTRTTLACLFLCGVVLIGQQRDQKSRDGPISVNLGDVFEEGKTKIDAADLSEFFYNGGFSLAWLAPVGNNSYTIRIPGLVTTNYSIEAVATDNAGLVSKSAALRFSVTR